MRKNKTGAKRDEQRTSAGFFFNTSLGSFGAEYSRFGRAKHAESNTSRKVEILLKNLDIR